MAKRNNSRMSESRLLEDSAFNSNGRDSESRRFESRGEENIEAKRYSRVRPKHIWDIPKDEWEPGKHYYGMRINLFKDGEPDDHRMAELQRIGFTPVPASRHPEYSASNLLGIRKNEGIDKFLHEGGILIVERDEELHFEEQEVIETENRRIVGDLTGLEEMDIDPRMGRAMDFGSRTYLTKNKSSGGRTFAG